MKKIILALFLLCAIVTESSAQITRGGEYGRQQTNTARYSQTNGLIKAGTIVLSSAGAVGLVFTIIGGVFYSDGLDVFLWVGLGYLGAATVVGVPLLAAGIAKQNKRLAIQTTPLLNYDFRLNDHLTLSTNLNVMSKSDFSSTTSLKRDHYAGAGLVLHF